MNMYSVDLKSQYPPRTRTASTAATSEAPRLPRLSRQDADTTTDVVKGVQAGLATIQPRGTVFLFTLAEPYRSGTYVSGPLKAIQNFIAELFTDAGTVRFSPTFGCRFARETRGVNAVAITDIRGALARGIDQIRINQRYRQRGTAPREEMIDRVNILGLQQLQDRVIASLSFTMESGEDTTIHLPISLEPN